MRDYHEKPVTVRLPTVSTHDTATVDLTTLGYEPSVIAAMDPQIIGAEGSDGVARAPEESVAISGNNLVVTEGSTGWSNGDEIIVQLNIGGKQVAVATMTTA